MALIKDSKSGRKDGGYSRIFGNEEIGALFSKVHATSIRMGNELEKIINSHSYLMEEKEFENFIFDNLNINTKAKFVITKKLIKKLAKFIECAKEPDYCILILLKKQAFIIELKDGDTFDTKKLQVKLPH
jgi:hypothetical protein